MNGEWDWKQAAMRAVVPRADTRFRPQEQKNSSLLSSLFAGSDADAEALFQGEHLACLSVEEQGDVLSMWMAKMETDPDFYVRHEGAVLRFLAHHGRVLRKIACFLNIRPVKKQKQYTKTSQAEGDANSVASTHDGSDIETNTPALEGALSKIGQSMQGVVDGGGDAAWLSNEQKDARRKYRLKYRLKQNFICAASSYKDFISYMLQNGHLSDGAARYLLRNVVIPGGPV